MKIGGWVMLAVAAWQILERFVLSFWLQLDESNSKAFGLAAFDALLGVAMLQGSELARKFVLFLTGLACVVLGLALVGLSYTPFWHLWPLFGTALAASAGVYSLNLSRETSIPRIAIGLILVVAGWIGSVVAAITLVGAVDIATIKIIREWSSPDRVLTADDVEMNVASPWVALKPGNPMRDSETALFNLAHTEVLCFAQLFRETRSFSTTENLESFLDELAKVMAVDRPGLETGDRVDTRIGVESARRMKISWRDEDGDPAVGYVTAWRDADVFYHMYVIGPTVLTKRIEEEAAKIEGSIRFSGSRSAILRDAAPKIRAACPLLTDHLVLALSRVIPADSPPEVYCRTAYRFAVRGQKSLGTDSVERLRALMQQLFQGIPKAQIGAFGSYVTRIGDGGRSSPAEDLLLADSIRVAVEAMSPEVQDELRSVFGTAIDVGLIGAR